MKKLIFLFIAIAICYSCKNSANKEENAKTNNVETQQKEENSVKDQFELSFTAIIENNDKFTLFFLEEGQENITVKNSVSINVTGFPEPQMLNFKIKKNTIPYKLFLKFGNDNESQKITIVNAEFSYNKDSFMIQKENFFQFFNPNQFIDYDRENYIAVAKPVKGAYKPMFISRTVLEDRILLQLD